MTEEIKFIEIIILCIILCCCTFAQNNQQSAEHDDDPVFLYGSYQYLTLPDHWNINYYGLSAEVKASEIIGLSGSILYGKGSNNTSFLHVPVTGALACLVVSVFDPNIENLLLLFLEKVQYNHSIKEVIFLSPYWSIVGADLAAGRDGKEGYTLFSSGVGINAKVISSKRIVLSSDFSLKYFIVGDKIQFGSGNQFGFSAGINLGYMF